jgi:hypothetical protein
VSTGGVANFLILYGTGSEAASCDQANPDRKCFGRSFERQPIAFLDSVYQRIHFMGYAGFLGQEQWNVEIKAGTTEGAHELSVLVASFADFGDGPYIVKLGRAN